MISRILFALSGRLPCRIISDNGQPYLERYYLFTLLGTRVYLHRFVGSDPDRGVHDHPWHWAFSIILQGWYYERRRSGTRMVRWFNWLTGDTFHRVILPADHGVHECWTLFAHRAQDSKSWGFLRDVNIEGCQVFEEYRYNGGAKPIDWWLTAPIGLLVKRQPRRPS